MISLLRPSCSSHFCCLTSRTMQCILSRGTWMQLESAVRAVLFQLRVCLVEPHCKRFVHFLRTKVDLRI